MKPARFFAATTLLSCLVLAPGVASGSQSDGKQNKGNSQKSQRQQTRFRGMDTNRDGVITRQEWRGNTQSFNRHDVNRDGVLSGNEVWAMDDDDWSEGGGRDATLEQAFRRADVNRDGILSRSEWTSDAASFNRVDVNRDGVVTEPEFYGEGWQNWDESGPDADRDNDLADRFRRADRNGDRVISWSEWTASEAAFNRRDGNRDGVLTEREFVGQYAGESDDVRRNSRAFQAGYDRGLSDGREAGRQDKQMRNQWDLEGQRELEQGDAGYSSAVGSREDYQAGYRAGFRAGYRQGFGPR